MPAGAAFYLARGDTGPVQQSSLTCGSAALTVARMLVSREFARWIIEGIRADGDQPDSGSESDRFAEHERQVMDRTNGMGTQGRKLNIPWPRSMGTPPWGAQKELESGAATAGAAYTMRLVHLGSKGALGKVHANLERLVRNGQPALLYVGNARTPRHITLVLPGRDHGELDVYDPATGSVTELALDRFASRKLGIAGWNVPWITVQPRKH